MATDEDQADLFGLELPGGILWQVAEIGHAPATVDEHAWSIANPAKPVLVRVSVRNRIDKSIDVPPAFYRDKLHGGPALLDGVTVHLDWAPFDPRTPDDGYPRDDDFTPVKAIRGTTFRDSSKPRRLVPKERVPEFELDLREWFNLNRPGYYKFHFEFDVSTLRLPHEEVGGASRVIYEFSVGTPPPRLTPKQLNKDIPALGGKGKAAELAQLIEQELPPRPETRPATLPMMPAPLAALDLLAPIVGSNGPWNEAEIWGRNRACYKTVDAFSSYDPTSVREQLERRLSVAPEDCGKLYVAAIAARFGSRIGASYLLKSCQASDETTVRNSQAALAIVLRGFNADPPKWLVELTLATLSDQRYAIGESDGSPGTIGDLADDSANLPLSLGWSKSRAALEKLIGMAAGPVPSSNAITALEDIGDPRAVPVLLEVLRSQESKIEFRNGMLVPESFVRAASALGAFKAREAVPILLRHLYDENMILALEAIGDPIAIPKLKEIAANGPPHVAGFDDTASRRTTETARIALITLSNADPIPGYLKLLPDQKLDEYSRRSIVWRLGNHRDPRAINALVTAIKTDPSGAVVNQAITVLSVFKFKAAAEGLIGCFDANFEGKEDWKRAYTPEMFSQNIADSLRQLTGEKFGAHRQRWQDWWQHTGRLRDDLK